jgi:hypothetical protein
MKTDRILEDPWDAQFHTPSIETGHTARAKIELREPYSDVKMQSRLHHPKKILKTI